MTQQRYSDQIAIRTTWDQRELITAAANAAGARKLSEWARDTLIAAAKQQLAAGAELVAAGEDRS